ncbi:MAG: DUF3857 domain-containing protein [Rhizobacter sp.]|nr:DUF3857 domain-containing protein [Ferruginibacter sp.]
MKIFSILMTVAVCCSLSAAAQDKCPVNFDKISAADFNLTSNVDTSFGAVILADVGKSSFVANKKGFFSLVYKFNRRIKIINAKGFDLATVKIPIYQQPSTDREEELTSLKASTYNVENGQLVEVKLNKDNVFKEVVEKNHIIKKFTMPAVKEGSVIDISYTIHSDFLFNLQPWSFQGSYPCLWSEYSLDLPEFFQYVFLSRGTHPFHLKDSKTKYQSYNVRIPAEDVVMGKDDVYSMNSNNSLSRWIMKDVPALKEENFTSSMDNHLARIAFQMSGQQFPDMPFRDVMGSWQKVCVELMKDKEFGGDFTTDSEWIKNALKTLSLEGKDSITKAKIIYTFLQKNFSSQGTRGIYASQSLKETFTNKKGYVPDINLLLTLLLKKADLNAFPVILSTRTNGFATAQYPILNEYNYVVTKLEVGKNSYFLDASNSILGFGKIPSFCFNGYGQVIDMVPGAEMLFSDSITEKKYTNVILMTDVNDSTKWVGPFHSALGYYESLNTKEDIKEKGKSSFEKKLEEAYTGDFSIDKIELKDLEDNNKAMVVSHTIHISRPDNNDIIYFSPMLQEGIKENYFKSSERNYPVELPYKMDETYTLNLEIPKGYVVDETPKSTRVSLNEGEGMFEYIISKNENYVALSTRLTINKSVFSGEDYETLRGFFDYVVKKHAEQIVFKKKS